MNEMLTVQEAAKRLRLSTSAVRMMLADGRLKGTFNRRRWAIPAERLDVASVPMRAKVPPGPKRQARPWDDGSCLSIRQAAKLMGLRSEDARIEALTGRLEAVKVDGRYWTVTAEAIERWRVGRAG